MRRGVSEVIETVLIVEDNDLVQKLVCRYVERAGYRVIRAGSAADALVQARACGWVDVVVADVVLPDGSGIALVQSLKRIYPELRTLYMSGYADARLTGGFIAKPFSSAELIEALRLLLDAGLPTRSQPLKVR